MKTPHFVTRLSGRRKERAEKRTGKKRRWKGGKTDREIYTVGEQRLFTFDLSRQLLFLSGDIKTRCPGNLTFPQLIDDWTSQRVHVLSMHRIPH